MVITEMQIDHMSPLWLLIPEKMARGEHVGELSMSSCCSVARHLFIHEAGHRAKADSG